MYQGVFDFTGDVEKEKENNVHSNTVEQPDVEGTIQVPEQFWFYLKDLIKNITTGIKYGMFLSISIEIFFHCLNALNPIITLHNVWAIAYLIVLILSCVLIIHFAYCLYFQIKATKNSVENCLKFMSLIESMQCYFKQKPNVTSSKNNASSTSNTTRGSAKETGTKTV